MFKIFKFLSIFLSIKSPSSSKQCRQRSSRLVVRSCSREDTIYYDQSPATSIHTTNLPATLRSCLRGITFTMQCSAIDIHETNLSTASKFCSQNTFYYGKAQRQVSAQLISQTSSSLCCFEGDRERAKNQRKKVQRKVQTPIRQTLEKNPSILTQHHYLPV